MAVTGSARVVLVVEDDESMREAIGNLLSIAGFVAVAYESAEAMLSDQTSERPICVISDLHLPAMSGLDLLTALRRRSWHPPVIFITADDMASTRQAAERLGAAAYLAKPFPSSALLTTIEKLETTTRGPQ
ncbi:MAG TPA: response regulator [Steroidobacteraceae bacterium]|jgi:FixJ family two-component response regulator|nr:response regulator [Steroidobacteraceae bacterium]